MASTSKAVQGTGGRASARPSARTAKALGSVWAALAAALLLVTFDAMADETAPDGVADSEPGVTDTLRAFADKAPLTGEELNTERAKAALEVEKVQINNQETTGGVWDNTAIGNDTGNNVIGEGAFTDTAGFVSTIQNTGNNVLIQNSTIINVAVEP